MGKHIRQTSQHTSHADYLRRDVGQSDLNYAYEIARRWSEELGCPVSIENRRRLESGYYVKVEFTEEQGRVYGPYPGPHALLLGLNRIIRDYPYYRLFKYPAPRHRRHLGYLCGSLQTEVREASHA